MLAKLWASTACGLALAVTATNLPAAPPGPAAPRAASLGLNLATVRNRLLVTQAMPGAALGLRAGDEIVAVEGRRVATEAAFMNRLAAANNGGAPTVAFVRGGRLQVVSPAGWMNPSQMVQTSQGVMHRDAAARLGLPGTPIPSGDRREP